MKQSGLKRYTPLKRGKHKLTRKPLRKVNPQRARARRERDFGEQAQWCRELPCCACKPRSFATWSEIGPGALPAGTPGPWPLRSDPHHEPSRGAGGTDKDTVPLCRRCHEERHRVGLRLFNAKWGVDLLAVAAALREVVGGRD